MSDESSPADCRQQVVVADGAGRDDEVASDELDEPATATTATHGELTDEESSLVVRWTLLTGNRWHLSALLLAAMTALVAGLLVTGIADVRDTGAFTRLFSSLVSGNLTLITVTITINQLILSREFAAPAELRDRIERTLEFRHTVEETADEPVSPVTPDAFLDFLVLEVQERASALGDAAATSRGGAAAQSGGESAAQSGDEPAAESGGDAEEAADGVPAEVEEYVASLVAEGDRIRVTLGARSETAFHALLTVLDADFTLELYGAERLRSVHGDDLGAEAREALDDVVELLEYLGVGRQYFKTLYLQRELAALSRKLLLVGLPAVASSVAVVWIYGAPGGARLSGTELEVAVLVATVIATAPLAVLVAYVLRITTVTRRTASLMPFTIREDTPL